mgnify:CR=1 FL=1
MLLTLDMGYTLKVLRTQKSTQINQRSLQPMNDHSLWHDIRANQQHTHMIKNPLIIYGIKNTTSECRQTQEYAKHIKPQSIFTNKEIQQTTCQSTTNEIRI